MKREHGGILLSLILVILIMLCMAYASVPLYRIFCKATGYGGTISRKSTTEHSKIGKKHIKVRLNADTSNITLIFYPEQQYVTVKPGVQKLVFYRAKNPSGHHITGMAVYNVSPSRAGKYFNKVACFCFSRQTFAPNQQVVMPVSFYIDPQIEEDPETKDIKSITLSYTFFPQ